jgi:hypothetical protein
MELKTGVKLSVEKGELIMSSSLKRPDGGPRFTITLPVEFSEDPGVQALLYGECVSPLGYEAPTQSH